MELDYNILSQTGLKSKNNEDSYALPKGKENIDLIPDLLSKGHLFIVCDGMGGHLAGEVASSLCAEWLWLEYYQNADAVDDIDSWIKTAVDKINSKLFNLSTHNRDYLGMGTTVVGAVVKEGKVHVFNTGDSRCYLLRQGELTQLTEDDSEAWQLYKRGELTKDGIITYKRKNIITAAIAINPFVKCHVYDPLPLQKDDILLLSSDGLHDVLTDTAIENIIKQDKDLQELCVELSQKAVKEKSRDDITVLLIKVID